MSEITIDIVLKNMDKIKKHLESKEIFATSGDCGNFAEALQNIIGGHICCSYENYGFLIEGEPAHCGIIHHNRFIDIVGEHENYEKYLRDWAVHEAYPEDDKNIQIECGKWDENDKLLYEQVRDENTVRNIEKIIKETLISIPRTEPHLHH